MKLLFLVVNDHHLLMIVEHIFENARDVSINGGEFYTAGRMSIDKNVSLLLRL